MSEEEKVVSQSNCEKINEQKMVCSKKGLNLDYEPSYCTIEGARIKAQTVISENGWNNIDVEDLAAEIWFHSYAFYKGGSLINMMKKIGVDLTGTRVWKSVSDGIDVVDGLDTATVGGLQRSNVYKTCFNAYVSLPFTH